MRVDEIHKLFLETADFLCQEGNQEIKERESKRMPGAFVPSLKQTRLSDRDSNTIYLTIVAKAQAEDAVKALRKIGITAKAFSYDRNAWEAEKQELETLKEHFQNKQKTLNQVATDVF
jgi:hypothetical protein|mmetsp:Transcript_24933/g.33397  ORF Transcript_24933/g.33397 Transcript_24933/m.33397 type:complete len:118 (+) Transcript_24933:1070-1423(+)